MVGIGIPHGKWRKPGGAASDHADGRRVDDFGQLSLQATDAEPGFSNPGVLAAEGFAAAAFGTKSEDFGVTGTTPKGRDRANFVNFQLLGPRSRKSGHR